MQNANRELFRCCLRILLARLRRNPCDIRQPGMKVRHISRIDIDKNIPFSLQYASQFWIGHFQRSYIESGDDAKIENFFQTKYLLWLETLALIGRLSHGVTMMMDLERFFKVEYFQSFDDEQYADFQRGTKKGIRHRWPSRK